MHSIFVQYLFLILIILALNLIADKLRLAYPIVLVVGGLALSFTTQFSRISIPQPDFVYNFYGYSCYPRVPGTDAPVGDPDGEGGRQVHHDLGSRAGILIQKKAVETSLQLLREERLTNGES